ncbi:hypothetical protein OMD46_16415 [Pseudomonas sp. MDMC_285]|nr:hypothetical protein [Pseudomonas sp. MDMC_285]
MSDVMKKCIKCEDNKDISSFSNKRSNKDGLSNICRSCTSIAFKIYRQKNRDHLNSKRSQHYFENKEKEMERHRQYRAENREARALKCAEWRDKNQEHRKQYRERNKSNISKKSAEYYQRIKGVRRDQYNKKYRDDALFALRVSVRLRTRMALRAAGLSKKSSIIELIGCCVNELKSHIEAQFKPGMKWENRGAWHIDHKTPLSSAVTEEEVIALCHYTNLQPLWAHENLSKGARLVE